MMHKIQRRGCKDVAETNIVSEYQIGNTKIKIADDYCKGKTAEDVDIILRRIAQNAYSYLSAAAEE